MINMRRYAGWFSAILLGVCICMLPIYLIINYTYNAFMLDKMTEITNMFQKLKISHKKQTVYVKQFLELHQEQLILFEKSENKALTDAIDDTLTAHKNYILNDNTLTDREKTTALQQIDIIKTEYIKHVKLFQRLNQINKEYTEKLLQL